MGTGEQLQQQTKSNINLIHKQLINRTDINKRVMVAKGRVCLTLHQALPSRGHYVTLIPQYISTPTQKILVNQVMGEGVSPHMTNIPSRRGSKYNLSHKFNFKENRDLNILNNIIGL